MNLWKTKRWCELVPKVRDTHMVRKKFQAAWSNVADKAWMRQRGPFRTTMMAMTECIIYFHNMFFDSHIKIKYHKHITNISQTYHKHITNISQTYHKHITNIILCEWYKWKKILFRQLVLLLNQVTGGVSSLGLTSEVGKKAVASYVFVPSNWKSKCQVSNRFSWP